MNNNEFPPISKNVADMTLYVPKKKKKLWLWFEPQSNKYENKRKPV